MHFSISTCSLFLSLYHTTTKKKNKKVLKKRIAPNTDGKSGSPAKRRKLEAEAGGSHQQPDFFEQKMEESKGKKRLALKSISVCVYEYIFVLDLFQTVSFFSVCTTAERRGGVSYSIYRQEKTRCCIH